MRNLMKNKQIISKCTFVELWFRKILIKRLSMSLYILKYIKMSTIISFQEANIIIWIQIKIIFNRFSLISFASSVPFKKHFPFKQKKWVSNFVYFREYSDISNLSTCVMIPSLRGLMKNKMLFSLIRLCCSFRNNSLRSVHKIFR